jgi:uncharacterized protein YjbI with pentapeptide repeats
VYRKAWRTDQGVQRAPQVFSRLVTGRPLDDLSLGANEGRLDLRGFTLPSRDARATMAAAGMIPAEQVDLPEVAGVALDGLDFTGADFGELCFYDADLRDCLFDKAIFRDLKLWRTHVRNCSFRAAKLAHAGLGPLDDGVANEYASVDFGAADLRRISCRHGTFVDVDFSDAKLLDIDFDASTFTRCTFAGRLARIIFWEQPPNSERPVRNDMEDVDFSQAELHWVEFRGLRLDRVTLPSGNGHVVVKNYRRVLERAIERLAGVSPYAAVFGQEVYWAHPLREIGIWHRDELGKTDKERAAISERLLQLDRECSAVDL